MKCENYVRIRIGDNMETLLEEQRQLQELLIKIEEVDIELKKRKNISDSQDLILLKNDLNYQLARMCLDNRIKREGLTPELIKLYSALDAKRTLESREEQKNKENQYNLSSEEVVSKRTGEIIPIKYMSISDKVKTIYQHTGEIVKEDDRVFSNHRERSCQNFINHLSSTIGISQLKERFGDNWEEVVAERYQSGYNEAIKHHIDKITQEVDEENKKLMQGQSPVAETEDINQLRIENQTLSQKLSTSEQMVHSLQEHISKLEEEKREKEVKFDEKLESIRSSYSQKLDSLAEENLKMYSRLSNASMKAELLMEENFQLKDENALLKGQIVESEQRHKEDMEDLRRSLTSVIPYEPNFFGNVSDLSNGQDSKEGVGFSK